MNVQRIIAVMRREESEESDSSGEAWLASYDNRSSKLKKHKRKQGGSSSAQVIKNPHLEKGSKKFVEEKKDHDGRPIGIHEVLPHNFIVKAFAGSSLSIINDLAYLGELKFNVKRCLATESNDPSNFYIDLVVDKRFSEDSDEEESRFYSTYAKNKYMYRDTLFRATCANIKQSRSNLYVQGRESEPPEQFQCQIVSKSFKSVVLDGSDLNDNKFTKYVRANLGKLKIKEDAWSMHVALNLAKTDHFCLQKYRLISWHQEDINKVVMFEFENEWHWRRTAQFLMDLALLDANSDLGEVMDFTKENIVKIRQVLQNKDENKEDFKIYIDGLFSKAELIMQISQVYHQAIKEKDGETLYRLGELFTAIVELHNRFIVMDILKDHAEALFGSLYIYEAEHGDLKYLLDVPAVPQTAMVMECTTGLQQALELKLKACILFRALADIAENRENRQIEARDSCASGEAVVGGELKVVEETCEDGIEDCVEVQPQEIFEILEEGSTMVSENGSIELEEEVKFSPKSTPIVQPAKITPEKETVSQAKFTDDKFQREGQEDSGMSHLGFVPPPNFKLEQEVISHLNGVILCGIMNERVFQRFVFSHRNTENSVEIGLAITEFKRMLAEISQTEIYNQVLRSMRSLDIAKKAISSISTLVTEDRHTSRHVKESLVLAYLTLVLLVAKDDADYCCEIFSGLNMVDFVVFVLGNEDLMEILKELLVPCEADPVVKYEILEAIESEEVVAKAIHEMDCSCREAEFDKSIKIKIKALIQFIGFFLQIMLMVGFKRAIKVLPMHSCYQMLMIIKCFDPKLRVKTLLVEYMSLLKNYIQFCPFDKLVSAEQEKEVPFDTTQKANPVAKLEGTGPDQKPEVSIPQKQDPFAEDLPSFTKILMTLFASPTLRASLCSNIMASILDLLPREYLCQLPLLLKRSTLEVDHGSHNPPSLFVLTDKQMTQLLITAKSVDTKSIQQVSKSLNDLRDIRKRESNWTCHTPLSQSQKTVSELASSSEDSLEKTKKREIFVDETDSEGISKRAATTSKFAAIIKGSNTSRAADTDKHERSRLVSNYSPAESTKNSKTEIAAVATCMRQAAQREESRVPLLLKAKASAKSRSFVRTEVARPPGKSSKTGDDDARLGKRSRHAVDAAAVVGVKAKSGVRIKQFVKS